MHLIRFKRVDARRFSVVDRPKQKERRGPQWGRVAKWRPLSSLITNLHTFPHISSP